MKKKIIGYLVFAFIMLVPFRMVYLEAGSHTNPVHVLLFLGLLLGAFIGGLLVDGKQVHK